jgi:uroporphyrinogen decarboxylase
MSLDHKEPDRCPMQIDFTPEFTSRLQQDMKSKGLIQEDSQFEDGTYLKRAIHEDMLLTAVGWLTSYYQQGDEYTDEWGIGWKSTQYQTKFGTGRYTDVVSNPLTDVQSIDKYACPDPNRPELYTEAARVIERYRAEYYIVGVTKTTIFETAWALRGLSQLLLDLVENPDLAERILDIPFHYHLTAAKRLVELGVDMIWTGDDVGTQHHMMMSPDMWRRFLKPRMARFFSELKQINPEVKTAYHSDGFIEPIIPDLIEIGLDVLNPVQPSCMDPAQIKNMYGDKLSFWGTIDMQKTLPYGSPEDVRKEVLHRLRTVGKSGGLIMGPTHNVQLDVPIENFWAMVETIRETRCSDPQ